MKVIYTICTIREINPYYLYASRIETACKIRAANFICIWMYLAIALIIGISSIRFYNNNSSTIKKNIGYPKLKSSTNMLIICADFKNWAL